MEILEGCCGFEMKGVDDEQVIQEDYWIYDGFGHDLYGEFGIQRLCCPELRL